MTPSQKFYALTRNIPELIAVRDHFYRQSRYHMGETAMKLHLYFLATEFRPRTLTLRACEMLAGKHQAEAFEAIRMHENRNRPALAVRLPGQEIRWYNPNARY